MEYEQTDPCSGVGVAQKLVDLGVKAGSRSVQLRCETISASLIYNDAGIVIGTVTPNPKVTLQGFKSVFRVASSNSLLGSKMALYEAKELKVKKVSIIDGRTAYDQGLAEEFAKVAKANGIQVVSNDFAAILILIKSKKPDAIFYRGYSP